MYTVSLQFGQAWVLDIFCGNSRDVQICPATTTILDILVVLRVLRLQHHQLLKHPSAILLEIFQHVLKWRPTHTAEILSGEEKTRRLKFVTFVPCSEAPPAIFSSTLLQCIGLAIKAIPLHRIIDRNVQISDALLQPD